MRHRDRESEQGAASVEQLKDLKNAIIAHLKTTEQATVGNETRAQDLQQSVQSGSHPKHKLEPEKTVESENAKSVDGNTYEHLRRTDKEESAVLHLPQKDPMQGLKKFLSELTAVQGIYTAAVMVPGPLALSLKNHAKEVADGHFSESSFANASSASQGFIRHSSSAFSAQSEANGSSHYEKVTVDERVVPVLAELQERLGQASVSPAIGGSLVAAHHYAENSGHTGWFSSKVNYDQSVSYSYYDRDRLQRNLEEFEVQPARVRLPETSISDYAKLQ